jgi:hypothetical protein
MKFTRNGSVQIIAGVLAGAGALVAACGGDDATTDNGGVDAGGDATASSSSTSSTSSGGSTSSTSSGGTDGGDTDAATDAATEAGGDGGLKAIGEPCTTPVECQSGVCFIGKQESYCTVKCTMLDDTDPVCEALKGDFDGECNKQGFCRKN